MIAPRMLLPGALTLFLVTGLPIASAQVLDPAERLRTAPPDPKGALVFDGNNWLAVANDSDLEFDTDQSFTIEAWIKYDRFSSTRTIFSKRETFTLYRSGDKLVFRTQRNDPRAGRTPPDLDRNTSTFILPLDQWIHIAAVYDAQAGETYLYLDGENRSAKTVSAINRSTQPIRIGLAPGVTMDAVRLWNVARSPASIKADLDRDLTVYDFDLDSDPPNPGADRIVPGLLGAWRMSGVTTGVVPDTSGQGRDATSSRVDPNDLADGLTFRPPPPLATETNAALTFDGQSGATITVGEDPLLNDVAEALTVETWINVDMFDQPWQGILAKPNSWALTRNNETSQVAFRTTAGSATEDLVGATDLLPGRWYHLVATWDGTHKRIYLDGILDAQATWSGPLDTDTTNLIIGGGPDADREFKGSLDDVRIWARARSAGDIATERWDQKRGFENGLRALWSFDNVAGTTALDHSYGSHHGVMSTGVASANGLALTPLSDPVATVPSPAGGALYFPTDLAQKSSVLLSPNPLFGFSEAMTAEAWISISSRTDKLQGIITKGWDWSVLFDANSGKLNFRTKVGSAYFDLLSEEALELDRWYHVAVTYDDEFKCIYLDGELSASERVSAPLENSPLLPVVISGNAASLGQSPFHGRIDSVRLWNVRRSLEELRAEASRDLRGTEAGLVGDWRFNNITGTAVADSSWNGLNGALISAGATDPLPIPVNGLPFDPPADGHLAVIFNRLGGTSDSVTVPHDPVFNPATEELTLETWLYFEELPTSPVALISKDRDAWELTLEPNGKLAFHTTGLFPSGIPNPEHQLISTQRVEPGSWYHVALVWNGASADPEERTKEIYLNGVRDSSAEFLEGSLATNSDAIVIGGPSGSSASGHFSGSLDEVRLWEVARTAVQVLEFHQRDLFGDERGLLGFWQFNQGGAGPQNTLALDSTDEVVPPATASDRAPINGSFSASMSILNRVSGVPLLPRAQQQYSLALNGQNEFIEVAADPALDIATGSLTLEAWIKPGGSGFRTIVMKGDHGYGLAIDEANRLRFFIGASRSNSLVSESKVASDVWQHVAVVIDGTAGTTSFYIDGKPAGVTDQAVVNTNADSFVIGREGSVVTGGYFEGEIDEVRVWNVARSALEIDLFAMQPFTLGNGTDPVGYWNFNDGRGTGLRSAVGGVDGVLFNTDDTNWRDGTNFPGAPIAGGLPLVRNPDAAGLWIGQIEVNRVNEVINAVNGAANNLTPTRDTATLRVLLHVDDEGAVHMLKDVIVMQKSPPAPAGVAPEIVLITKPELIPQYEGVRERKGKLVGLRYGTVAFAFDGHALPMLGGVSPGGACTGMIQLGKSDPANPFRHKFHPDHRTGYDLQRQFSLQFDGETADPLRDAPGYGVKRLTGTWRESISGVHKITLMVEGSITLHRVSTIGALNDGQ